MEIWQTIYNYIHANYESVIFLILLSIAWFFFIKVVNKLLTPLFEKVKLESTVKSLLRNTVRGFLWIIFAIIVLSNLGVDVTGFVAGIGILGFIVAFATKDVLSNIAAGIFIFINKPFRVGEKVQIDKITGRVAEMSLAACIVHTKEKEYVMIPNSKIWGGAIINLSRLKDKH